MNYLTKIAGITSQLQAMDDSQLADHYLSRIKQMRARVEAGGAARPSFVGHVDELSRVGDAYEARRGEALRQIRAEVQAVKGDVEGRLASLNKLERDHRELQAKLQNNSAAASLMVLGGVGALGVAGLGAYRVHKNYQRAREEARRRR